MSTFDQNYFNSQQQAMSAPYFSAAAAGTEDHLTNSAVNEAGPSMGKSTKSGTKQSKKHRPLSELNEEEKRKRGESNRKSQRKLRKNEKDKIADLESRVQAAQTSLDDTQYEQAALRNALSDAQFENELLRMDQINEDALWDFEPHDQEQSQY
ncbi:hypothetical protein L198_03190 [Cryptococcus wingfieldii CBS 7118]|uniref:BZIP domain-containing protein n=1 Tax=Cryptococcus wingfieldii CBS 7118 TaxID=1295528 RepID=A0A1E3JEN5_9TREE|nr:hypothetical protein L198_03190 [Cryptococcus wingfieldii CBS 7118]ODN99348.1 hypothetical protein L198_03190 [Cryptococcus wingfieldii CBS 7118]